MSEPEIVKDMYWDGNDLVVNGVRMFDTKITGFKLDMPENSEAIVAEMLDINGEPC
jgi:hypothetical protein